MIRLKCSRHERFDGSKPHIAGCEACEIIRNIYVRTVTVGRGKLVVVKHQSRGGACTASASAPSR